jgi:amino acid transporter
VAALVSAVPALSPDSLAIALGILAFVTALNLRGIAASARAFLLPTTVFIAGIYVVIGAGLARSHPAAGAGVHPAALPKAAATVGILLLKAFAAGCSALTGVEAIANDVPAFRAPTARSAMRTEVLLGVILASMLLGLAFLTVGPTVPYTATASSSWRCLPACFWSPSTPAPTPLSPCTPSASSPASPCPRPG